MSRRVVDALKQFRERHRFIRGMVYELCLGIFTGHNLPGSASTIFAILFLGGVQLIGIGILGEYVGIATPASRYIRVAEVREESKVTKELGNSELLAIVRCA